MAKKLDLNVEVCGKWACRFQKCMRETRFDLERCQWEAKSLKDCCKRFNANGVSTHCAFYDDDDVVDDKAARSSGADKCK